MKHIRTILTTLCLAITLLASGHTYAPQSVLANGSFHKICVRESGLYSITFKELQKMGLDPNSVRIYGFGGAMLAQNFSKPKIDDLPLVPYLRLSDRIVFYGQGVVSWAYNGTRFVHTTNPYSLFGYYFITSGENGVITTAATVEGTASSNITSYAAYLLHEKDSLNLIDHISGSAGGGREFYGESFMPGSTRSFAFTFPEAVNTSLMTVYADLAASSQTTSTFRLTCDNLTATTSTAAINDNLTAATPATINKTTTPATTATKNVSISFSSSASTAMGYLNYITLTATCPLKLTGNQPLFFRTTEGYNSNALLSFTIADATSETEVWDITDLSAIKRISTRLSGTTLTFKANNREVHEYVAFNPTATAYKSVTDTGAVANQNLHALSDIDMVIVAPEAFLAEAQRLGAAHQLHDGFSVAVVTDKQVYNEFSSGTPDATAIRWLMKMLYDRAKASAGTQQPPRYLLLFGDGTFDNRKLLPNSGNNWLLTYQAKNSLKEDMAYSTDDYFAFLDDNEGETDINGRMDISVGRLPVNTQTEASGVVDKLIRQMQTRTHGRWKNQLLFLADDGDHNLHTECSDAAAESMRTRCPDFVTNKVYLDAYDQEVNASGESYPLAEARVHNLLSSGVLLFDYCGHSGYNNATSEGLISSAIIRNMQNENQGLWLFASCSFAHFDAGKTSAAEEAILNPNGGALAICATSRTVYAHQNKVLNKHICDSLFAHRGPCNYPHRIGDAIRLGKNAVGSETNKMSYILLGDPATSLQLPVDYQVVTTQLPDTLRALSVNSLDGYIATENGDTVTSFNGTLTFTVFDKLQQITTLDNDEANEDNKKKFTYNDRPNILFQGETTITNGHFTASFMLPKDIRYNYGGGRIAFYAFDAEAEEEAVGHYDDFIVGGSSPVAIVDTVGPEINLYMNTPSFTNGDRTDEKPHFFAEISDEHGINTVGSGIGHDLLLVVDDKASMTYTLNDYYTATNGYQSGLVSYKMSELEEGQHSLFFRAWDLLNNSSSKTITFNVVKGLQPGIMSVIGYPNPITSDGVLTIEVDQSAPDTYFETTVFVYDLSGRLVHSISQRGIQSLSWNLSESTVPEGVYLYRVQLSSPTTKTMSKTAKLIITK